MKTGWEGNSTRLHETDSRCGEFNGGYGHLGRWSDQHGFHASGQLYLTGSKNGNDGRTTYVLDGPQPHVVNAMRMRKIMLDEIIATTQKGRRKSKHEALPIGVHLRKHGTHRNGGGQAAHKHR